MAGTEAILADRVRAHDSRFGQFFVGPLQWRQPEGNTAGGLFWSYPNSFVRLLSQGCCGW